jgi:hypothetical protein
MKLLKMCECLVIILLREDLVIWVSYKYHLNLKKKALLKLNVDFGTLLIGAEGVRLLRECESKGDPTGAKHRGGSRTARGKRTPAAEINNQV